MTNDAEQASEAPPPAREGFFDPRGEGRDGAELMTTQAELNRAQAKYQALVEQIPAIVYLDVADEDMSTTYVSPQFEQLLGYTTQEYIEDPQLWEKMLHPDDRQGAMDTYLHSREAGVPFVF